jgi:hypothetical protein
LRLRTSDVLCLSFFEICTLHRAFTLPAMTRVHRAEH